MPLPSKDIPQSSKLFKLFIILEDGRWHSIGELAQEIGVEIGKVQKVCDLLSEFAVIESDGQKVKQGLLLTRCEQGS